MDQSVSPQQPAPDQAERFLYTTMGLLGRDELGMILPHEHIFVDLRTPETAGYAEADEMEVIKVMSPKIEEIKQRGITALVECSTTGVGRRADLDLAVSRATNFPILVPTGAIGSPGSHPSCKRPMMTRWRSGCYVN